MRQRAGDAASNKARSVVLCSPEHQTSALTVAMPGPIATCAFHCAACRYMQGSILCSATTVILYSFRLMTCM